MRVATTFLAAAVVLGASARPGLAWHDLTRGQPTRTLGEIKYFAGAYQQVNWAACDGAAGSVKQNAALYTVLFDAFGGTMNGGQPVTYQLPALPGATPTAPARPMPQMCVEGWYPDRDDFDGDDYVGQIHLARKDRALPGWAPCQGQTIAGAQTTQLAPLLGGKAGDPVTLPVLPDLLEGRLAWFIARTGAPGLVGCIGDLQRWPAAAPVPDGWLPCDGRLFPVRQEPALFSILGGNRYGGDGYLSFAVPKLPDEGGTRWLLCIRGVFAPSH